MLEGRRRAIELPERAEGSVPEVDLGESGLCKRCVGEADRERDRLDFLEADGFNEVLERLMTVRDPLGRLRDCEDRRPPSGRGESIGGSEDLLDPLTSSLIAGIAGE